jgi:hypothetical protein
MAVAAAVGDILSATFANVGIWEGDDHATSGL